jgi:hypothetical protein
MFLDRKDLRGLSLVERKEQLKAILPKDPVLIYSEHLPKVFKLLIKLDEQPEKSVRLIRNVRRVARRKFRTLSRAAKALRGQTKEFTFGTAYAFTQRDSYGKVYRYKF